MAGSDPFQLVDLSNASSAVVLGLQYGVLYLLLHSLRCLERTVPSAAILPSCPGSNPGNFADTVQ